MDRVEQPRSFIDKIGLWLAGLGLGSFDWQALCNVFVCFCNRSLRCDVLSALN